MSNTAALFEPTEAALPLPDTRQLFMICWRMTTDEYCDHTSLPNALISCTFEEAKAYILSELNAPAIKGQFNFITKKRTQVYAEIKIQDNKGYWRLYDKTKYYYK